MFVLTVDRIDSRHRPDAVDHAIDDLRRTFGRHLVRRPRRTAGDDFQALVADPAVALDLCLHLTREGEWNVGCGIGAVDTPLPSDVRAGSGSAFVAARRAVDAAKRSVTRCAVRVATDDPHGDDVGALLDLVLAVRARRTREGWQVYDRLRRGGVTQRAVAEGLGITEQAVSARIRAADIRVEEAALPALVRRLRAADSGAEVLRGGARVFVDR